MGIATTIGDPASGRQDAGWVRPSLGEQGLINNAIWALFQINNSLWLDNATLALSSVITTRIWKWLPFWTIIFLAGRMAIPREPYEAAEVDGASRLSRFVHTLFSTIWALGDFNSKKPEQHYKQVTTHGHTKRQRRQANAQHCRRVAMPDPEGRKEHRRRQGAAARIHPGRQPEQVPERNPRSTFAGDDVQHQERPVLAGPDRPASSGGGRGRADPAVNAMVDDLQSSLWRRVVGTDMESGQGQRHAKEHDAGLPEVHRARPIRQVRRTFQKTNCPGMMPVMSLRQAVR